MNHMLFDCENCTGRLRVKLTLALQYLQEKPLQFPVIW